jgi:hypothetical protein
VTFEVPIREQGCKTKEGKYEDKESKKRYAVMRKTKRVRSLKEPIRSTWEDLFFLEEDLMDIFG